MSFELKRGRESKQIESTYYLEIHIYVTAAPKADSESSSTPAKLKRSAKVYSDALSKPFFTADQLYGKIYIYIYISIVYDTILCIFLIV